MAFRDVRNSPRPLARLRCKLWHQTGGKRLPAGALAMIFLSALFSVPEITWGPSGLVGGGFTNVVVASSADNVVVGADVAGVHRTAVAGDSWTSSNGDVTDPLQMSIASMAFSSNPLVIYAAYGTRQADQGGFQKTINGGETWTALTDPLDNLVVSGQGPNVGAPSNTDVRSTGNLIVLDEEGGKIYVGTYEDGLYRSGNGGSAWMTAALGSGSPVCGADATCYIRSVVSKVGEPTTLYVGTYGDGIIRVTGADGPGAMANRLPTSRDIAEELVFDPSGALWCACGTEGIYKAAGPSYNNWLSVNGNIETGGVIPPQWVAIATNGTHMFAGAHDPALDGELFRGVKRLQLSVGPPWEDVPLIDSQIGRNICGPPVTPWWIQSVQDEDYLLGHFRHDVAMLSAVGTKVYVAGRSGVWRSDNSGDQWCPAVRGLGLTAPKDIATSPVVGNERRVYFGSTDWTYFWSTDNAAQVHQQDVAVPGATYGFTVAVDPFDTEPPAQAFLGVGEGDYDPGHGEVLRSSDPSGGAWIDLNIPTGPAPKCVSGNEDGRPIGLAVGKDLFNRTALVAAVDGCGLWRWLDSGGAGTWEQVAEPGLTGPLRRQTAGIEKAPVVWPQAGTPPKYVYVLDRTARALWRSNNYGANGSWTLIWEVPILEPPLTDGTGYIAGDPQMQGWVWVTTDATKGTYLLTGADGNAIQCQKHLDGPSDPIDPGPVAIRPGTRTAYIATRQTVASGSLPKIWRGDVTWTGTCNSIAVTWQQISDPTYQQAAVFPRALSVGKETDDYAYVGTGGQGAVVVTDPP